MEFSPHNKPLHYIDLYVDLCINICICVYVCACKYGYVFIRCRYICILRLCIVVVISFCLQLKKTVEELNDALSNKEEIAQRCRELDMQVSFRIGFLCPFFLFTALKCLTIGSTQHAAVL